MAARREVALELTDLDAVIADARMLHERGYEKAGQWDLTQICDHVAAAVNGAVDGAPFRIGWPMKVMVRVMGMKGRMFRTRRLRAGLPAPSQLVFKPADSDPQREEQAVKNLENAITRYREARGRYHDHPIFGPLTDDQWDQFHVIHAAHHLSFLRPRGAN